MSFFHRLFKAKVEETKQELEEWKDPDGTEESVPCDEILLTGIDKSLHDNLMGQAVSSGAVFDGDQATLHGIVLGWNYDEASGNLHITPLKHPWYLDCGEIESKLQQIVANAKGAI